MVATSRFCSAACAANIVQMSVVSSRDIFLMAADVFLNYNSVTKSIGHTMPIAGRRYEYFFCFANFSVVPAVGCWPLAVNNFVVELWLHLSIIQARLILHSVCTNLGGWSYGDLLHQHKPEQCKGNALHYSDKNFAIHSFTPLGHATHHTERARYGGEDCD